MSKTKAKRIKSPSPGVAQLFAHSRALHVHAIQAIAVKMNVQSDCPVLFET